MPIEDVSDDQSHANSLRAQAIALVQRMRDDDQRQWAQVTYDDVLRQWMDYPNQEHDDE